MGTAALGTAALGAAEFGTAASGIGNGDCDGGVRKLPGPNPSLRLLGDGKM
jgi:hypothetical protein